MRESTLPIPLGSGRERNSLARNMIRPTNEHSVAIQEGRFGGRCFQMDSATAHFRHKSEVSRRMKTQINWMVSSISILSLLNSRAAEPTAPVPKAPTQWPDGFSLVQIRSTLDESFQPAYFFASQPGSLKPLVVSLHTWSGDYTQSDPLAEMVKNEGWNYIHPDFRGPNRSKDACLSKKAISDMDDSIQYAINTGSVTLKTYL